MMHVTRFIQSSVSYKPLKKTQKKFALTRDKKKHKNTKKQKHKKTQKKHKISFFRAYARKKTPPKKPKKKEAFALTREKKIIFLT